MLTYVALLRLRQLYMQVQSLGLCWGNCFTSDLGAFWCLCMNIQRPRTAGEKQSRCEVYFEQLVICYGKRMPFFRLFLTKQDTLFAFKISWIQRSKWKEPSAMCSNVRVQALMHSGGRKMLAVHKNLSILFCQIVPSLPSQLYHSCCFSVTAC